MRKDLCVYLAFRESSLIDHQNFHRIVIIQQIKCHCTQICQVLTMIKILTGTSLGVYSFGPLCICLLCYSMDDGNKHRAAL